MSLSIGDGSNSNKPFFILDDDGRHTSDGTPMNLTDHGQGTIGYFFKAIGTGTSADTASRFTLLLKERINAGYAVLNKRSEVWSYENVNLTADPGVSTLSFLQYSRLYTYDGTNNILSNSVSTIDVFIPDKWYFSTTTWEYFSGTLIKRVYDCDTGAKVYETTAASAVPTDTSIFTETLAAGTNIGSLRLFGYDAGITSNPVELARIGEYCQWNVVVPEAELQALSQTGFADINRPANLIYDFNFMIDWAATDPLSITNRATGYAKTEGATADVGSPAIGGALGFSSDNPVEVINIIQGATEHDGITFSLFSAFLGTAYVVTRPFGSPAPTEAEIAADVGSVSFAYPAATPTDFTFSGLTTGTALSMYLVIDTGGGSYSPILQYDFTTPTKYSEIITDVTGAEVTEQSGIQWAWFDEENPSTLSSPSTQGVAELTDATGLLEITLPPSITTPKGSKGTMVLRADWNGSIQTASHLVEVK